MRTLVVIPTYNEKGNLEAAVAGVLAAGDGYSVLVVDDASPDGTGDVADGLAHCQPDRVFVRHRPAKSGLGSAYREGFAFALEEDFATVCQLDADGSHDPADLPRLVAAVEDGADLAIGSRRVRGGKIVGWGPRRHLMSALATWLARRLLGLRTRDVTAGFRCWSAQAARLLLEMPLQADGYDFQEESLFHAERLKLKVVEVPVTFRDRRQGASKLDWAEIRRFLRTVRYLRQRRQKK